ncbi:MAG: hypothetical protein IKU26_03080 [Clostridia bacterium]|nr:hypothetical protein [Clostridia bacterium]
MRKGFLLFLSVVMMLSFVACTQGAGKEESSSTPTEIVSDAASASPEATTNVTDEPTEEITQVPTEEPTEEPTDEPEAIWIEADDACTWIEDQSREIKDGMVYETVTVSMEAKGTFIQLNQLLTKLIGKDGQDGQGYIQIKVGDGSIEDIADSYFLVQLVGSSDTTLAFPGTPSEDAMTWYPRGNSVAAGYSSIFLNQGGSLEVPNMKYGNHGDICAEGYKFAFTQTADGKVLIRSLNENSSTAIQSYDYTTTLASEFTLGEIVGDYGKTGEDGVYFRLASYANSDQVFTITVAYPA